MRQQARADPAGVPAPFGPPPSSFFGDDEPWRSTIHRLRQPAKGAGHAGGHWRRHSWRHNCGASLLDGKHKLGTCAILAFGTEDLHGDDCRCGVAHGLLQPEPVTTSGHLVTKCVRKGRVITADNPCPNATTDETLEMRHDGSATTCASYNGMSEALRSMQSESLMHSLLARSKLSL